MYNNFGQPPQLYAQQTGYAYQQQQQQQQPQAQQQLFSQPTGFQQPQQTGYQQQLYQQPTGVQQQQFYQAAQKVETNTELKIPNIRLSFIAASDQQQYEQLFRSAVSRGSNSISADAARDVLVRSGLQPQQLGQIWELSDLNKSGQLLFPEFALALYLVSTALQTRQLPYQLDSKVKKEVEGFVDAINFSVPEEATPKAKTPFDNMSTLNGLQFGIPTPTGGFPAMPQTSFLQPQATGYQQMQPQTTGYQSMMPQSTGYSKPLLPQSTGFQPLQPQSTGYVQPLQPQSTGFIQPQSTGYLQPQATGMMQPLTAQKTGVGNNQFFQSHLLQPQQTGFKNFQQFGNNQYQNQEFIKPQERDRFAKIFDTYDSTRSGQLQGSTCAEIFRKSGLNRSELEKVWNLVNVNDKPFLNKDSFSLGMWLIYKKLNGHELPTRLPESLIPNSTKILDDVKDKLKLNTPAFSKKPFGSSTFRNNDDDVINTSNNRRKDPVNQESDLELIRARIEQKKSELELLNSQMPTSSSQQDDSELRSIEELKSKIRSLPIPKTSGDRLQLKDRLNSLTSKVPEMIHEISRIDNDITNFKIDLYRLQNPSAIVGTGPNGEVTDSDKRKAKSKALLAQRMAALTGKPVLDNVADFEEQERKFNDEVAKVKQQNKENQEIIYDIEISIKDLASGAQSSLSREGDASAYRKFELGLDVQPDVASFIKELRIATTSQQKPPIAQSAVSRSYPAISSRSASPAIPPKPSSLDSSSRTSLSDRSTSLKEQAKKRMAEKLAKFGIHRNRHQQDQDQPESNGSAPSLSTPSPSQPHTTIPAPQPVPVIATNAVAEPQAAQGPPPVVIAIPPAPPAARTQSKSSHVDEASDEDDEEKNLRERLAALELKKSKKEARKAELRRQLEAEEKDSDEDESIAAPQQVKTFIPQSVRPVPVNEVPKEVVDTGTLQHHDTNPFAKSMGSNGSTSVSATSSKNPFGKPPTPQHIKPEPVAKPLLDKSQIEAQRKAQRGLDNDDDGWSDDENVKDGSDDDNDALPNRQGAAHLAGLLFSGMGPARTNSSSQVGTPKEENKQLGQPVAKAVPIAAPIPSISTPVTEAPVSVAQPSVPLIPVAPPIPVAVPALPAVPTLPTIEQSYESVPSSLAEAQTVDEQGFAVPPTAPVVPDEPAFIPPSPPPVPSAPVTEALPPPPAPPIPSTAEVRSFESSLPPPIQQSYEPSREQSEELFATPTAASPEPEAPSFIPPPPPQMLAPPVPVMEAPSMPDVPPPPPMPLMDAPPPPPLPSMGAPPPPPLPTMAAPPPPPLPVVSSPAAPIAPAPPVGGGLPFLAQIQQRRDERFVVE